MTTWFIKTLGNDWYHVGGTNVDEEVNGPQLMGMLTCQGLSPAQARKVLWDLYQEEVAFTLPITFDEHEVPKAS